MLADIRSQSAVSDGVEVSAEHTLAMAAGAFVVIVLWFGMIPSSLWLDETGTWWVVKDGMAQAFHRPAWSGQSPLYFLIAWLSSRLFGLNEIALRLPSVLAMAGAICFLFSIAARLLDRASAIATAFVFVCAASYYAIDARPYALGMLFTTASMWFLLRWIDSNRLMDAALHIAASALLIWTHPVLSLTLGAGIIFAVAQLRHEPRRLAWLAGFEFAAAVLCLPLLAGLSTAYGSRAAHTFAAAPTMENFLPALIPCAFTGGLILCAWLVMACRREASLPMNLTPHAGVLIAAWSLFAPLVLFLLAVSTNVHLFVPKYYSAALPGQALVAGGLLASIRRIQVRNVLICLLAALAIIQSGKLAGKSHGNENWREALSFVRAQAGSAPVLLVSGFVEASDFTRIADPQLRDVLFAPELLYGEPARSIRLPNAFSGAANPQIEKIARDLRSERRFFLMTENPDRSYEMWLLGAMNAAGVHCESETTGSRFGYLWVTRFSCE